MKNLFILLAIVAVVGKSNHIGTFYNVNKSVEFKIRDDNRFIIQSLKNDTLKSPAYPSLIKGIWDMHSKNIISIKGSINRNDIQLKFEEYYDETSDSLKIILKNHLGTYISGLFILNGDDKQIFFSKYCEEEEMCQSVFDNIAHWLPDIFSVKTRQKFVKTTPKEGLKSIQLIYQNTKSSVYEIQNPKSNYIVVEAEVPFYAYGYKYFNDNIVKYRYKNDTLYYIDEKYGEEYPWFNKKD